MTTLVTYGDRLVLAGGSQSLLKRGSVPFGSYFGGGTLALSGDGRVISYQTLYDTQPWVAIAINKLSRQIVRLPLRVYRQVTDDGESEPVHDETHPLVNLLNRPYPRASAATLKQKASFPMLLHGNGVLWKRRNAPGAPPSQLVPLDWRFLTPYCTDDGHVILWELSVGNTRELIDPADVVQFAWEAGTGDLGVSPLRQLGTTLRMEDAAQRYQSASFDNGARPSGALVLPAEARLDKDERDELRQEIRAQHTGDNTFNVALLTGGMDWKPFSHTAVEAELIEQRKLNREEVAAVYDIDPPMIGILDHATFSNVSEMHKMLYGPTLGPWLALEAEIINAQLIDAEPRWQDERLFVAFDLTEVLRSNTLEEIQAIQTAIGSGVMTPNEGRARLRARRSPEAAADQLYMPTNNMQPMGSASADAGTSIDSVIKAHIDRAVQRAASKMGTGHDGWDRDRFIREITADGGNEHAARVCADALEAGVRAAAGDAQQFRAFGRALAA